LDFFEAEDDLTMSLTLYQSFEEFVHQLGPLITDCLQFAECNKFFKLKQSEYALNEEIIEYYRQVFSKKTTAAMRRKWHIKDKLILIWVVFKLCEKKGIADLKMKFTDWEEVASILKLPKEFLMRKWICLIRHTTYNFHWTLQEEETLQHFMSSD